MSIVAYFAELPASVAVHLAAALLALILGPVALYRKRRDGWHKAAGYAWVIVMAATALSAFGIRANVLHIHLGLGPIHMLSAWVLLQLFLGVRAGRQGQLARHQATMRGLYWGGLTIAGSFTFLPGRTLNHLLFSANPEAGYGALLACLGVSAAVLLSERRPLVSTRSS